MLIEDILNLGTRVQLNQNVYLLQSFPRDVLSRYWDIGPCLSNRKKVVITYILPSRVANLLLLHSTDVAKMLSYIAQYSIFNVYFPLYRFIVLSIPCRQNDGIISFTIFRRSGSIFFSSSLHSPNTK